MSNNRTREQQRKDLIESKPLYDKLAALKAELAALPAMYQQELNIRMSDKADTIAMLEELLGIQSIRPPANAPSDVAQSKVEPDVGSS